MKRLEDSQLTHKILPQEDADALYRMYPDLPRNHLYGCPSCGKNDGEGVDGHVEIDGEEFRCNCHDQLQRHKHYLNAGIGSTYQFITWGDFIGDSRAFDLAMKWDGEMEEKIETGQGLYICSPVNGSGKTLLGTLLLRDCIRSGHKCYMTTFQNMLTSMKSGWKDAEYDKWYRQKVDSAQVLLIDDIGKEVMDVGGFNNDFAKQTIDSLLRTRVQQGRPTMFTSNFVPDELEQMYGIAFTSLLTECCGIINVVGDDHRSKAKKRTKGHRRVY